MQVDDSLAHNRHRTIRHNYFKMTNFNNSY